MSDNLKSAFAFLKERQIHPGGIDPESFNIVEFSDRPVKHVENNIHEVKQYPSTFGDAFGPEYLYSVFFKFSFNALRYGPHPPVGVRAAHDKIVRHIAFLPDFQNHGILRFFLPSSTGNQQGFFPRSLSDFSGHLMLKQRYQDV